MPTRLKAAFGRAGVQLRHAPAVKNKPNGQRCLGRFALDDADCRCGATVPFCLQGTPSQAQVLDIVCGGERVQVGPWPHDLPPPRGYLKMVAQINAQTDLPVTLKSMAPHPHRFDLTSP